MLHTVAAAEIPLNTRDFVVKKNKKKITFSNGSDAKKKRKKKETDCLIVSTRENVIRVHNYCTCVVRK